MQAELKKHHGGMTIFINGRPHPFTTYKPTELPDDKNFEVTVRRTVKDMAARGVHIHFVPIFFDWSGPGQYDFSKMDWRLHEMLAADPEAWLFIRVQAATMRPKWWLDAHPEGVLSIGVAPGIPMDRDRHATGAFPSLASDFWETAGIPALRALARHVRQQDYASRIIGYLPTSYNTNEWFLRSYNALQVNDLCPAMQQAFAAHTRQKFGREFPVPDRIQRDWADHGSFINPDPLQARFPVAEYYEFLSNLCAEKILAITAALRAEHAPDRLIIGTFYGYLFCLANFYWLADSAHLALCRLVEDGGPDFTCSPLEYFTRNLRELPHGGFCWAHGTGPDTGYVAGKGYFGEDDFCPPHLLQNLDWSSAGNEKEDSEILKRNFAFTMCKGQLQWWYDLHGHWFEKKNRLDVVEKCVKIADDSLQRDRSQVSQIAVVMDERGPMYMTLEKQLQRTVFFENLHFSFTRIGAPIDVLLLSDLPQADLDRYKAIFFPTCFSFDHAQRQLIDQLKANGRTLVFYQAAGLINPDAAQKISADYMPNLVGMQVQEFEGLCQIRLTTGDDHELLRGCEDTPYGVQLEKFMRFQVNDPQAAPLAYYSGRGPVGAAIRRHETWTSIYTAVPVLPMRLVRNIASAAGVHIYTDAEDVLYACRDYVSIFTRAGGKRTLRLPRSARVRDCFSGKQLAPDPVTEFSFPARKYSAYLFLLE